MLGSAKGGVVKSMMNKEVTINTLKVILTLQYMKISFSVGYPMAEATS